MRRERIISLLNICTNVCVRALEPRLDIRTEKNMYFIIFSLNLHALQSAADKMESPPGTQLSRRQDCVIPPADTVTVARRQIGEIQSDKKLHCSCKSARTSRRPGCHLLPTRPASAALIIPPLCSSVTVTAAERRIQATNRHNHRILSKSD